MIPQRECSKSKTWYTQAET